MTEQTVCPSVLEITRLLRGDTASEEICEWVRHIRSCVVCTDTVIRLKMVDSIIDRLRLARGEIATGDSQRIDSLILTLLTTKARRAFSTSPTDRTADGSFIDESRNE